MYDIVNPKKHLSIFSDYTEETALNQLDLIKNHPALKGYIAIMPDVHAGSGCVIGFTGQFTKGFVIPNLIGHDSGCSVSVYNTGLKKDQINRQEFEDYITENIKFGFNNQPDYNCHKIYRNYINPYANHLQILDKITSWSEICFGNKYTNPLVQLGTIGGGEYDCLRTC